MPTNVHNSTPWTYIPIPSTLYFSEGTWANGRNKAFKYFAFTIHGYIMYISFESIDIIILRPFTSSLPTAKRKMYYLGPEHTSRIFILNVSCACHTRFSQLVFNFKTGYSPRRTTNNKTFELKGYYIVRVGSQVLMRFMSLSVWPVLNTHEWSWSWDLLDVYFCFAFTIRYRYNI